MRDKNLMMDSLKKSLIREVRLSWGGGGSPPQKNFFLWLLLDFFFTQVSMHDKQDGDGDVDALV